MARQVNTLCPMYYQGAGAGWRGGERCVIVYWQGKKSARMLDLDDLHTYLVKADTLVGPYARVWDGERDKEGSMRPLMRRLAAVAKHRQSIGVELPLETIGAILTAARKVGFATGEIT